MKNNNGFLNKIGRSRFAFNSAVIAGCVALNQKFASAKDYDFLKKSGNNTFKSINSTAQKTGVSLFSLMKTLGIIAVMVSLILCGVAFVMSKNATKRDEAKGQFFWIILGGALIFGVMGIIGLVSDIGTSIK